MMSCFLDTFKKEDCLGCEACLQVCHCDAIAMEEDEEGFRYPKIDEQKCVSCGLCRKACPMQHMPDRYSNDKMAFGGYIKDADARAKSTSGGAFSAIAEAYCEKDYVIFGAEAEGVRVFHSYTKDINELDKYRKSKYSQSVIGHSYQECKAFLDEGKRVLFSGTPCQIAGLKAYLQNKDYDNLLTVEVICEGVPSPKYIEKYADSLRKRFGSEIIELDYRYTDANATENPISGKWDFQVMHTTLENGKRLKKDRWFNPFWSVWLNHLMSRPSCYSCPFANTARVADISLGDLWGVHLYCPELYGRNLGSSLVVCNTAKGKAIFKKTEQFMHGHELAFETALKYQSPMRKTISYNPDRSDFMKELMDTEISYEEINRKWAKKPTLKLLYQKYIWGNRQKIAFWNLKKRFGKGERND